MIFSKGNSPKLQNSCELYIKLLVNQKRYVRIYNHRPIIVNRLYKTQLTGIEPYMYETISLCYK